jgi:osmotically-inducible protein OsmY
MTAEDSELRQRLLAELAWDFDFSLTGVEVEVARGRARLTGTVDSWNAKQAVHRAVKRVRGLRGCDDRLVVSADESIDTDDLLEARCREAIAWEGATHAVRVRAAAGRVRLEGSARDAAGRAAAENALDHVCGIVAVENAVCVRPSAEARRRQLPRQVEIAIDGGRAVVDGWVRSWAERKEILSGVFARPGVKSVVDRLVVAAG